MDNSKSWWRVRNLHGDEGYVPSNYVKLVKPSLFDTLKGSLRRQKKKEKVPPLPRGDASQHSSNTTDTRNSTEFRIVKYTYEPKNDDELAIQKGEKVWIVDKSSDGWWKGRRDGSNHLGWFPSNYLYDDDSYNTADDEPDNSYDDSCVERVLTLYAYSAQSSEELSFDKDEMLDILNKPEKDPDWWKARNNRGQVGLIPKNYVQCLSVSNATSGDSGIERTPSSSTHNTSLNQSFGGIRAQATGLYAGKEWYYGKVARSQCDQMLEKYGSEGEFIVRESENHPGEYTLTLRAPVKTKHFLIKKFDNNCVKIGEMTYESMDELVSHYKRHPIFRSESLTLHLGRPFCHPEF